MTKAKGNKLKTNINNYFNKFSQQNKFIFSKLINTVNTEENKIVTYLDDIKNKIKLYLNEEIILQTKELDNNITKGPYNFRKQNYYN